MKEYCTEESIEEFKNDIGGLNIEPCEEVLNVIELDCEDLYKESIDVENFRDGIEDYSFVCGAITALCNVGLTPTEAIEFISNRETIEHNIKVTEMSAKASIEASKNALIRNELENI